MRRLFKEDSVLEGSRFVLVPVADKILITGALLVEEEAPLNMGRKTAAAETTEFSLLDCLMDGCRICEGLS